jgi:DNA replication protein DnaC
MAMTNDLISQLRALHLYGMAAALEELLAERPRTTAAPLAWIRCLIEAEQVERQVRSLRYQLRVARFPIHRELDHFQWEESDVKRELIEPLANGEFTQEANNLILVGGTGTGKTHLPSLWGSPRSIKADGCASTMSWTWLTVWSRRKHRGRPETWPGN